MTMPSVGLSPGAQANAMRDTTASAAMTATVTRSRARGLRLSNAATKGTSDSVTTTMLPST